MQKSLFETECSPAADSIDILSNYTNDAYKHTSCHHELAKGEVWLGNTGTTIPEHYKHLKTIRLGEQAYCIHGKPLDRNYMRPLIIHVSEEPERDKIYLSRMND
jgi:hypothetical protein